MKSYNLNQALYCEQMIAVMHTKQVAHGVAFDIRKAHWYTHLLTEKLLDYYLEIKGYLSYTVVSPNDGKSTIPFKKDRSYTGITIKWFLKDVSNVSGPFCKVTFEDPDTLLSKRARLGKQLIELGWEPKEHTPTGIPVLVKGGVPCPNLTKFGTLGVILSKYYTLVHRKGQIQTFLKYIWYDDEGVCRISSEANTIGTPTFRYTHKIVANIPKAKSYIVFGKEMRSLFSSKKGYRMVGSDASGLELRMLAHYINSPSYTDEIVNGDIHVKNQEAAGLPTRDDAKTFIYAFLYGAGNGKLGEIVGGSVKAGELIRRKFLAGNPELNRLIKGVQKEASDGFLTGLDGRRITMRRKPKVTKVSDMKGGFTNKVEPDPRGEVMVHKALNTLVQASGAVLMKYAGVVLNEWVRVLELDAVQVISYHDEVQYECKESDVELLMILMNHWVRYAGELLGLNCPLASDSQVGNNWSETH